MRHPWASLSPNVFQIRLGPTVGAVPQGGEERPPSALAQEGKEQATETVQRKRRGGGASCGPRAWEHRQGTSKQRPRNLWAHRQLGRGEAPVRVLPVPRRCLSECQQTGPQKVTVTFWRRWEQPLALQSPVCLGPAARPQARGSVLLPRQGIWPRLLLFQ